MILKPYVEGKTLTANTTLVSDNRIANLIMYSHRAKSIPGDYAEFGVFSGGGTEIIARINPEKVVYSIDSFEGLPAPTEFDQHKQGDFRGVDLPALIKYFEAHHPNVLVIKGFSPAVFAPIIEKRFAFVHVDVDLYRSVLDACEFFYPRLSEGGIMIFDDYGWPSTPGAPKAIHEYFKKFTPYLAQELTYVDGQSHKQFIVIK